MLSDSRYNSRNFSINTQLLAKTDTLVNSVFKEFSIQYSFSGSANDNNEDFRNFYREYLSGNNRDLYRKTTGNNSYSMQQLKVVLPKIIAVGKSDEGRQGFQLGFKNQLALTQRGNQANVLDKYAASASYQPNDYLNNNLDESLLDERPELMLQNEWLLKESEKVTQHLSINVNGGPRLVTQISSSEKQFQQFVRRYEKLAGEGELRFSSERTSSSSNSVTFRFESRSNFPSVAQIAPLEDSANLNYLRKGNPNLREQDERQFTLSFFHSAYKDNKSIFFGGNGDFQTIDHFISSGQQVDANGRTIQTVVNTNGCWATSLSGTWVQIFPAKNGKFSWLRMYRVVWIITR